MIIFTMKKSKFKRKYVYIFFKETSSREQLHGLTAMMMIMMTEKIVSAELDIMCAVHCLLFSLYVDSITTHEDEMGCNWHLLL